jgi:hypothetical protein
VKVNFENLLQVSFLEIFLQKLICMGLRDRAEVRSGERKGEKEALLGGKEKETVDGETKVKVKLKVRGEKEERKSNNCH